MISAAALSEAALSEVALSEAVVGAVEEAPVGGAGWYGPPSYLKHESRQASKDAKKRKLKLKLAPKEEELEVIAAPITIAKIQEAIDEAARQGEILSALDAEIQLLAQLSFKLQQDEDDAIALLLLAA